MNLSQAGRLLLTGFLYSQMTCATRAAVLTSTTFSLGFGFTGTWNNSETAAVNTPITVGDFTFNPVPTGPQWSSTGAKFVNRLLSNGAPDGDVAAFIDAAAFQLPVIANYNGPAPADASGSPNYRLRIEITSISIYGGAHPASSLHTLAWSETTPGHTATSPSVALNPETNYNLMSNYRQLAWNPPDFDQPIAAPNTSYTRTFDILGGNGLRYGEGIEVQGQVSLIYDATPQTGVFRWQTTGLGDWNVGSNWDRSSAPSSNAVTVVFGAEVSATTTVVSNSGVLVKAVEFDSADSYVVGGAGSVTLSTDAGHASVDVFQGTHQFQAIVNLNAETDADVAAGASLAVQNALNMGVNSLNKTGSGTLQLNNVLNTGSGTINGMAGTIAGSGRVSNDLHNTGASVAPGIGAGILSVGGNYAQGAGGVLEIEIGGTTVGTLYDQLSVDGQVVLDGTLDVSLISSYTPGLNDAFTILSASGGCSGTFSTLASELPALVEGLAWQINYGTNDVVLSVISAGLPSDYNNDRTVDTADYVVWRKYVNTTNELPNDPHGGTIGAAQYGTWRAHFGETTGGESGFVDVVPEPSTCSPVLIAYVISVLHFRRAAFCSSSTT